MSSDRELERELAFEKQVMSRKPVECPKCKGRLEYTGSGIYQCEECGTEVLDEFGKVKRYIEEHGPSSAFVISQETGVKMEVIDVFLKKGRVEIPEGSNFYVKCKKCGCSIKYGRYCPECAKSLAGSIKAVFAADVGERPKREGAPDMSGKMHFKKRDEK